MRRRGLFSAAILTSLCLIGCGKSDTPASGGGTTPNASGDYVGALGRAQKNAITTVDTTSLEKAVQMFNVDKGRYPKDLNELVQEKYMPKLPETPFGMKLAYDPGSGKVSVVKQ
jgi:hypothetical protein